MCEKQIAATVVSIGSQVKIRVRRSTRVEVLCDAPDNLRVGDRIWCERRVNDPFPRYRELALEDSERDGSNTCFSTSGITVRINRAAPTSNNRKPTLWRPRLHPMVRRSL